MKKYIALVLALMLCFSLCACGESQEEKIAAILTQNSWYSPDRESISQLSDDWTVVCHSYTLTYFEDGSLRGDYLQTQTGVFNKEDELSYTGTWSVDGNSIIMEFGYGLTTVFIFTEDNVLHGPQSEGYTYLPMNHTND